METFLNLVWLAVTLAAIWLWRFRWTGSRQNPKHSTGMEMVAMVCALALLFPVISLTDDLHPETVAVDAASGKRNASLIAASVPQLHASSPSLGTHLAVGQITTPLTFANVVVSGLTSAPNSHDLGTLGNCSAARSPPSTL